MNSFSGQPSMFELLIYKQLQYTKRLASNHVDFLRKPSKSPSNPQPNEIVCKNKKNRKAIVFRFAKLPAIGPS
jgi:hypothetical protein